MSAMEPYRFTVRGVDPELVRQVRILAIKLDMTQAQLVNAGLRAVLAHNGLAAVVDWPAAEASS